MRSALDPDLDVGSYYAEVEACELEVSRTCKAKSNYGSLQRNTFFVSNASDGMIGTPYVITKQEYDSFNALLKAGTTISDLMTFWLNGNIAAAFALMGFGVGAPNWYYPGTRVYTVRWLQSRRMWKDGEYTKAFEPFPESWEVGYVDVKYAINDREYEKEKNFYGKESGKVLSRGKNWPWEPKYARGLLQPYIVPAEKVNKEKEE